MCSRGWPRDRARVIIEIRRSSAKRTWQRVPLRSQPVDSVGRTQQRRKIIHTRQFKFLSPPPAGVSGFEGIAAILRGYARVRFNTHTANPNYFTCSNIYGSGCIVNISRIVVVVNDGPFAGRKFYTRAEKLYRRLSPLFFSPRGFPTILNPVAVKSAMHARACTPPLPPSPRARALFHVVRRKIAGAAD